MKKSHIIAAVTAGIALCAIAGGALGAIAMDVIHNQENTRSPFASSTMVPQGYNTYYISGSGPAVVDPNAPAGSSARFGDIGAQTTSTLAGLKVKLAALGLTFNDVVAAHVFVGTDPASNGAKSDFAAMNAAWLKVFGTAEYPNKPARSSMQAAYLVNPGALVEIEFTAVKKAN